MLPEVKVTHPAGVPFFPVKSHLDNGYGLAGTDAYAALAALALGALIGVGFFMHHLKTLVGADYHALLTPGALPGVHANHVHYTPSPIRFLTSLRIQTVYLSIGQTWNKKHTGSYK
jgi:hypothetical protein